MAFVKIHKSAMGAGSNHRPVIRMGSHLQSEKQTSRSIYIAISRTVIELAGWALTELDAGDAKRVICNVAIHEGTHTDAGFLLLEEDPKGYRLGTNKGTDASSSISLAMNISVSRVKHYVLNDPTIEKPPEEVEFTVDEKEHTILIQCPDWLRYNPQSVQEEPDPVELEEYVEPPPPPLLTLNREERRRLAKKVVARLGR